MVSLNKKYLVYECRKKMLKMYFDANCGHIACSLSCIDLIYSIIIQKKSSEKFILSKGHAAGALYSILNLTGEISDQELSTFYKEGTKLPAHPAVNSFSGIPFALGTLGHGFSISCGIALALKCDKKNDFTFVLMSDGETNEGTTWEASHFAVQHCLDNLIVFIDKNAVQGFGKTSEVLGDTSSFEKWRSIGFDIIEIDGHDFNQIDESIQYMKTRKNSHPKLIICNTLKGKGVDFMENKLEWHYLPMNAEQYSDALVSIEKNKYEK